MGNTPSNSDDTIDSRDVIERIEELEGEREALAEERAEAEEARDAMPAERGPEELSDAYRDAMDAFTEADEALKEWDDENGEELRILKALAEEAEGYSDWRHGVTLIRDSYFEDYAQELAEEIGAIDSNANWPNNCIDWERAARELQQDYTSIDFDGVDYWVR